jgi:hypothetical protein
MSVADVPGDAQARGLVRRCDLDQRLGLADHPHDRAVVEHEPVAVAQHRGLRQIEQEARAGLAGHDEAAAMAIVGCERDPVDRAGRAPVAR